MDRRREGAAVGLGLPPNHWEEPRLPFKANADRRHHIPRPRYRATNWSAYDAALRDRGSLTVDLSWESGERLLNYVAASKAQGLW